MEKADYLEQFFKKNNVVPFFFLSRYVIWF
jgi:hypothetical protein